MDSTALFNIKTTKNDKFYKLNDFFTKESLDDGYSLDEWVYKFNHNGFTLLVPCKHIFETMYGSYPNIKQSLLTGQLNNLYHRIISIEQSSITINCTDQIQVREIEPLVRILSSKNLQDKFNYHFFQLITGQYSKQMPYFKTHFLYDGIFQVLTTIKTYFEQKIYLVTSIDKIITPAPFNKIKYLRLPQDANPLINYKSYEQIVINKHQKKMSNTMNNFYELLYNVNKYNIEVLGMYYDRKQLFANFSILSITFQNKYFHM